VGIDKWPHEGLARVSIVNYHGVVLMDNFVMPPEGAYVTDYRTKISGVSAESLMKENGAITFVESKEIAFRILKDKIIIGHSVFHDFQALEI
jgi:RNA exonuclease 4